MPRRLDRKSHASMRLHKMQVPVFDRLRDQNGEVRIAAIDEPDDHGMSALHYACM